LNEAGAAPQERGDDPGQVSPGYVRYVLTLVFLVAIFNVCDRTIMSILVEEVKADLALDDRQIGLLMGLAFTYGLNFLLAKMADVPMLGASTVIGAMIFLWVVGLLATLVPALRGTSVPPVVATRTI